VGITNFVHVNGTSRRMEGSIGTALEAKRNNWRELWRGSIHETSFCGLGRKGTVRVIRG
jgi:hypothetical protein